MPNHRSLWGKVTSPHPTEQGTGYTIHVGVLGRGSCLRHDVSPKKTSYGPQKGVVSGAYSHISPKTLFLVTPGWEINIGDRSEAWAPHPLQPTWGLSAPILSPTVHKAVSKRHPKLRMATQELLASAAHPPNHQKSKFLLPVGSLSQSTTASIRPKPGVLASFAPQTNPARMSLISTSHSPGLAQQSPDRPSSSLSSQQPAVLFNCPVC